MACLRARVFSRRWSNAASSASMSVSTSAMAACSGTGALECDHVREGCPLRYDDRRSEVVAVAVFVGDVFDEQHEQDVDLVLAGIHAAAQFVAGGPEGGVKI